jgi:hypothetical protein
MSTLAIVLIVLLLLVAFGGWCGRGAYGSSPYYGPGVGLVGLVIVVLLVLALTGTIHI